MLNQERDYFSQFINEQPKTFRERNTYQHKADATFVLNLQIPIPRKKQEVPQKVHPYVKLANQRETKARKQALALIDQRNRCKVYRNILEQQERMQAEKRRGMRIHKQIEHERPKERQKRLKPRKAKKGSQDSESQTRGPPYMPNILKMQELFPKKQETVQKPTKYSRSRSKYARKVMSQIRKQRERLSRQNSSKNESQANKMEQENPLQQQPYSPLQNLLVNNQSSQGQSKKPEGAQQEKNQSQSLLSGLISSMPKQPAREQNKLSLLNHQPNRKTISAQQSHQKKPESKSQRTSIANYERSQLTDLALKQQMLKMKQEELKKQKERLQQQKRVIQQRLNLQKEKEQLNKARLELQRRQRQISQKEASANKKIHKHRKQEQTKREKQQPKKEKQEPKRRKQKQHRKRSTSSEKLNWHKELQRITGYNPSDEKYRKRDRQQIKQSGFSRLHEEQRYSRRKGMQEQEDYYQKYEKKSKKSYNNQEY